MPTVRAKFKVDAKEEICNGKSADGTIAKQTNVKLSPVMSGSEENKTFWKWSPGGSIQLACVNQAAADQFELGREYYVDFTPA